MALTHKFKAEHAEKTLYVPGGDPSPTVTADTLTQAHIDAFDDETKAHFFDAVAPAAKKVEKQVGKETKDKEELSAKPVEELQSELDELQEKYDAYSDAGKKGKHGQQAQARIDELNEVITTKKNESAMAEQKEWDPNAPHTLDE